MLLSQAGHDLVFLPARPSRVSLFLHFMTDALNSDKTASVALPVGAGRWRWAARGGCLLAALTLLWPCWVRSSSRLGDLYDYSLFIASAQTSHGLDPSRSPDALESLTFLYNAGCEALLGQLCLPRVGKFRFGPGVFVAVLLLLEGRCDWQARF